jgi:hypothetical protein
VRGLTLLIGAVHGDFYVVTGSLINNGVILRRPRGKFRFSFVQLPRAHLWIVGEGQCRSKKAKHQRQSLVFVFIPPIELGFRFLVNIFQNTQLACNAWILAGEQFGLLMHTATTEDALLCTPMKSSACLLNLNVRCYP